MNEQVIAQENLSLPHDIVVLPSQGKFYKNKKKSVKVGYLTASDENLLGSVGKLSGEELVMRLVRSKLYEPDLNPRDMLEGDIEAILLFLRTTSFGPEYNFVVKDPKTSKEFETAILIDELNYIDPKIKPDSEGLYTLILPKSKKTVRLKVLNIGEDAEIESLADKYPKGMIAPIVTKRLEKQIVELDGNRDKGVIATFVNQMPIMDSKEIKKFLIDCEPKIDLNKQIIAPSGEEVTVTVNFGVEFFRPFF